MSWTDKPDDRRSARLLPSPRLQARYLSPVLLPSADAFVLEQLFDPEQWNLETIDLSDHAIRPGLLELDAIDRREVGLFSRPR